MTTFDRENLKDARFVDCNLDGAELREVTMVGARIIGSVLIDVEIDALVKNLTVNGVDVVPLVEAELDRRHPERVALRPTDVAGAIAALDVVDAFWEPTLARVRGLPEELRYERVGGEWSTVETLRHLLFVYDAWFGRAVLGEAAPYHPLGLPASFMTPRSSGSTWTCGRTSTTSSQPGRARQDQVRAHLATLDDEALTRPVPTHGMVGFPPDGGALHPRLPARDPERGVGAPPASPCATWTCWIRRAPRRSSGSANRQNTWPDGSSITRTSSCGWCSASRAPASTAERNTLLEVGHADVEVDQHLLLARDRRPDGRHEVAARTGTRS